MNNNQSSRGLEEIFETYGNLDDDKNEIQASKEMFKTVSDHPDKDGLESLSINASDAFEVFQGKLFTIQSRESIRGDYSLADTIEKRVESPFQRFTRLRRELLELSSDLNTMADTKSEGTVWSQLFDETKKMLENTTAIENHPHLLASKDTSITAQDTASKLQLISSELQQQTSKAASNTGTAAAASTSSTTSSSMMQFVALEKRIAVLELLLGSASNALDMEVVLGVPLKSSVFPLIQSIGRLEKRVALLDETALEQIRNKASNLRVELDALSRERNKSQGSELKIMEAAKKVNDLHDKVNRIESVAEDLPSLLIRLKSLEDLHVQSGGVTVRLQEAEVGVKDLTSTADCNKSLLAALQQGLSENVTVMQENMMKIDGRINALLAARR